MGRRGRGRAQVGWCPECNVPLLGGKCARCGSSPRPVQLTPPGDARPAFPGDVRRLNELSQQAFGSSPFPTDKVVLLSKLPAVDRAEEVVVDGEAWASVHFDLLHLRHELLPRWPMTARLPRARRWVDVDPGAARAVRGGANLLAPGVLDADPLVAEGDEVVLYEGVTPLACGRARMTGGRMAGQRGYAVKVRAHGEAIPPPRPGGQTLACAVEANREYLEALERRAVEFIRRTAAEHPLPLTVSYSGGKDSLATLLLAVESGLPFEVLFGDTGLELPGTVEHVREVAGRYGLVLRTASAGDAFWEHLPTFGPPSVEARWCCKVAKLGPLATLIQQHYPDGTLSLIGQRGLESFTRAQKGDVWRNPWVGNQVGASPIQRWPQLAVWLYVFFKGAPYNRLYEQGFDRLGCFLCPSSGMADLAAVAQAYPDLWARWQRALDDYCRRQGLPPAYARYGFWRWRRLPPNQQELKRRLGVEWQPPRPGGALRFAELGGFSPCRDGGFSAELACGTALPVENVAPWLVPLGEVRMSVGLALARDGPVSWQVFSSGTVVVRAPTPQLMRRALEAVKAQVRKAMECTGCGVCAGRCPEKAIRLEGDRARVGPGCTRCGECLQVCPLVKFDG